MKETQIKEIEKAKTFFNKNDEDIEKLFISLLKSFESHPEFKKIEKFYNSKIPFLKHKDYLKLYSMLKKFVKSFN